MADVIPPIRILPMSKEEFEGRTAEEVQSQYFLDKLPIQEGGRYYYRTSGLEAEAGTIVLFQYDNKIIASAVFDRSERLKQPDGVYRGTLNFRIDSIQVFDPVGLDVMHKVWPEFKRFSNGKRRLKAEYFPEFERRLKAPRRPPLQVHDLKATSVMKRSTQHTASAAVLSVGAELSRRSYDVTFTLGNTRKVDMLCSVPDGMPFKVQVKGISNPNGFYVDKSFFEGATQKELFLVVVFVPKHVESPFQFFVLSHDQAQTEFKKMPTHKKDGSPYIDGCGLNWGSIKNYKNAWAVLPRNDA